MGGVCKKRCARYSRQVYRATLGYSGGHQDIDAEDVHGEDGVNDAEAFLFDEGGEAFVSLDEVDAALLGEIVEGGAK